MISRHIIITGKVQGVFFRKHAKQKAEELNVNGWVKNINYDKVEIIVQGNENDVADFIEWCKDGSPKARVENVLVENNKADDSLKGFSILYED